MISVIIVSYNTRRQTLECVESLLACDLTPSEVVVVDNDSHDGTVEALRSSFPEVVVVPQRENLGFAKACNIGARRARGRYLGIFNSDCVVERECVSRLVGFLERHPTAAAAAPRLLSSDGRVQANIQRLPSLRNVVAEYVAGHVPDPYRAAEIRAPTPVESCSGAALVIRRDDFFAVGGFHEDYFMYVEDVELCRRLRALGRGLFYVPNAVARHEEGASTGPHSERLEAMLSRNREDYLRRTMPARRAALAIAALRLGKVITPLRTRLIAAGRRMLSSATAGHD